MDPKKEEKKKREAKQEKMMQDQLAKSKVSKRKMNIWQVRILHTPHPTHQAHTQRDYPGPHPTTHTTHTQQTTHGMSTLARAQILAELNRCCKIIQSQDAGWTLRVTAMNRIEQMVRT